MESDLDMFSSQPPVQESQEDHGSSSSSFVCGFLILFHWDDGAVKPFQVFRREDFFNEIKDRFIDKNLPDKFRLKKLKPMKYLPGKTMSLFGKMEASKFFKKNCEMDSVIIIVVVKGSVWSGFFCTFF